MIRHETRTSLTDLLIIISILALWQALCISKDRLLQHLALAGFCACSFLVRTLVWLPLLLLLLHAVQRNLHGRIERITQSGKSAAVQLWIDRRMRCNEIVRK